MFLIFLRDAGDSLNDCKIMFVNEIYKIEEPGSAEGAVLESPMKSMLQLSFACCLNP